MTFPRFLSAAARAPAEPGARAVRRRRGLTQVTGLDLEGDRLYVVQAVTRNGQVRVLRQAAAPLELGPGPAPDQPAVVGAAVARALRHLRISPGAVVMGVPRAQGMVRLLTLPPAQRATEIAAMVHFQVSRDLPFRLEEASLDFQVLAPSGPAPASPTTAPSGDAPPAPAALAAPPTQVLAAVVRRATVEHYDALAKAAGLKLVGLGLRSLAGARALEFCHRDATGGCVALVSLREREVICDVLLDHGLIFSRVGTLPSPAEGSTPGELSSGPGHARLETALLELVRSLHSYESAEGHRRVSRFFVTGATGAELELAAALGRRFGVPAQALELTRAIAGAEGDPAHLAGGWSALGLAVGALDPSGMPVDFLHPKRPPVPRDGRRVRRLGLVAACLAVVLGVAGLRTHGVRQRERQRAELQQQVALATKNLAAFRLVRSQARALQDWSAGSRNWLDHLTLLSALLPPSEDLYVTAIASNARDALSLSLRVRRGEIVDRLSTALRSAGYNVKAPAITPAADRHGYRFQANLELTVPAGLGTNLDAVIVSERALPLSPPERAASDGPPSASTPNPTSNSTNRPTASTPTPAAPAPMVEAPVIEAPVVEAAPAAAPAPSPEETGRRFRRPRNRGETRE